MTLIIGEKKTPALTDDQQDVIKVLIEAGKQHLTRAFVIGVLPTGEFFAAGSSGHEQSVKDVKTFLKAVREGEFKDDQRSKVPEGAD